MKRALISVSDKRGIVEFARDLVELGWEIVSTGGTAGTLRKSGVRVTTVASVVRVCRISSMLNTESPKADATVGRVAVAFPAMLPLVAYR